MSRGVLRFPVRAAAEVEVLIDSGSGIAAVSEELLEALRRQPGIMQTALTQAFVGHARVVASLGQECDNILTQSCPLHLTIETSLGSVRFTMPFIVLPGGGDVVIIGHKTLRETHGIDVMAQLKTSGLKAHGREDGSEMITAGAVGEPNAGAMLRAAMAVTAFGPGSDAPGDVDDDATLTLLSQRPMMFHNSEVEMQDRVGALGTAVDDAFDK